MEKRGNFFKIAGVLAVCLILFCGMRAEASECGSEDRAHSFVTVAWANGQVEEGADWDLMGSAPRETAGMVVFSASENVRNFTVWELRFKDIDENGRLSFLIHPLRSEKELASGSRRTARFPTPETIPQRGISYEDSQGETRYFSIGFSGRDGSLFLMPFEKGGEF